MSSAWKISCGMAVVLAGGVLPWTGLSATLTVSPVEVEFRQLERDIPSLYLINGLFLSVDQAKSLAALQTEGKQVTDKIRLDLDQLFLNHEKELNQWLEESLRAGTVDGKGQAGTSKDWVQRQKVRKEWMALLNAQGSDLTDIAGKTRAVLTPAQADIVSRFVPCFIPPRDFRSPERVGQADGDTSVGETILSRLREVSKEQQELGLEKAMDTLVPYVMQKQKTALTAEEIQKLRASLKQDLEKMIRKIQAMNDADFQLEKSKLAQKILCLDEKPAPEPDSREEQNKIKRYLLNPGIQYILIRRSGATASDSVPIITQELQAAALQERGKPFRALALANELNLTPSQADQLLPIVRAVIERRKLIDNQARRIMQEALPVYQTLVKELADQQPSSRTETTASQCHNKVRRLYEEDYMKELLVAEGQVDLLLAADQVALLIGQNKKDGKSKKTSASKKRNDEVTTEIRRYAAAVFDTMDKSSDAEWVKIKSATCRHFVESCGRDRIIDRQDIDVAAQSARAEQVLDKARKMVQADYLRAREDLIVEICPRRNQPRPALYSWKMVHGDPLESLNPTTYLLFSPAMETVLERAASRKPGM